MKYVKCKVQTNYTVYGQVLILHSVTVPCPIGLSDLTLCTQTQDIPCTSAPLYIHKSHKEKNESVQVQTMLSVMVGLYFVKVLFTNFK